MEINKYSWEILKSYLSKLKNCFLLRHLYGLGTNQNKSICEDENQLQDKDTELLSPREKTDFRKLCRDVINVVNFNSEKNTSIEFHYKTETVFLNCNKELIKFAIKNVLENFVNSAAESQNVLFEITDNQKHLKIAILQHYDDSDQKLNSHKVYKGKNIKHLDKYGTSFMIVKKAACYHDGTIIVNSNRNKITEFCMMLPLSQMKV